MTSQKKVGQLQEQEQKDRLIGYWNICGTGITVIGLPITGTAMASLEQACQLSYKKANHSKNGSISYMMNSFITRRYTTSQK
jgi:hypothetical protein